MHRVCCRWQGWLWPCSRPVRVLLLQLIRIHTHHALWTRTPHKSHHTHTHTPTHRYDEYASISEANPPANALARAGGQLGRAIVKSLAAIDEALEKNQVGGGRARREATLLARCPSACRSVSPHPSLL